MRLGLNGSRGEASVAGMGSGVAGALVAALDLHDRALAGHSVAVGALARDTAVQMGLSEQAQLLVHTAGLVHDVGKIAVPIGIVWKPGPLTLEERRVLQGHVEAAEGIIGRISGWEEVARAVRHQAERVDGGGYPDGLKGSEIPLASRIVAVANAYDELTMDLPFRDGAPGRVARLRLAQAAETEFDPLVLRAFEAFISSN